MVTRTTNKENTTVKSLQIKVEEVAYHRNGMTGAPFYVVRFEDAREGPMLGIVFAEYDNEGNPRLTSEPRVAVLQRDLLDEGQIGFGINSWRGDNYAQALIQAIQMYPLGVDNG
jgi:hypothetical protein